MGLEENTGDKLREYELALEMGKGADPVEVKAQADLISEKWKTPENKSENPLLLMLGGFQGSGKTTTLETLVPTLNLTVISPDEIRHNLFTQKYPFSEEFIKLVNATKFELINRAMDMGNPIVIDQSLTPDRVSLTKTLLQKHPEYQFLSVFLTAPHDTLKQRVIERASLPGRYRGTVEELEASIDKYTSRYGDPQHGGYDLLIDSSINDPLAIVDQIQSSVRSKLETE